MAASFKTHFYPSFLSILWVAKLFVEIYLTHPQFELEIKIRDLVKTISLLGNISQNVESNIYAPTVIKDILFGFSVLGDDVKEVLICAPSFSDSTPKTLQCGDQEVIDIKRSTAGYYWKQQCNETEIISWLNNPDAEYPQCERNISFYQ